MGSSSSISGGPTRPSPILRDAIRVLRASGVEFAASYAEMLLARAELVRGNVEAARELATPVIARFAEMGARMTALEAALVLAEVETEAGRPAEALALIEEAEEAAHGEGAPLRAHACLCRARALMRLGEWADSEEPLCDEGLSAAREFDQPYEEALLLAASAQLAATRGESTTAVELGAESDRLLARLGVQGADRQVEPV